MADPQTLLDIERAAWAALATSGEAAAAFYERSLADDVLMLLPGGTVIDDRSTVVDSMRGEPWTSYDLSDMRVHTLTAASAVVAYRATATRGDFEYSALFNSTYVEVDGEWRLALHQQTPV